MAQYRSRECRLKHQAPQAALVILALVASWTSGVNAHAQSPKDPSADFDRDQLYEQVAREAEILSRHFSLLKKVVQLVRPTVVHIEADRQEDDRFGRSRRVEEAGSGVIIRHKNKFYAITNRHVIRGAALADISARFFDGHEVSPSRVWTDPETDIAVMEVARRGLVSARLGNSNSVEIGDFVLAVGSPFGLSHSVTYGIVSAKGRRDLELGEGSVRYQNFIQTDAAINPGNSGGPLLNLRGEVVGINTAIASSSGGNEGIGFSIPINMVMVIAKQLIDVGRVERAFLGVHLDSKFGADAAISMGLPRLTGARVSGVTPNSPAEAADVQVGDVILALDDIIVEDDSDLVNRVSLTPVGKEVKVTLFRGGKQLTVRVRVGDRNSFNRTQ